ncbi:MAG: ABC transporter ATP-binding protein/permease [Bacteroidales bacterium]|nr:ABC transporter ATP-binding protein/permease [Bacteroidales bacterium]
MSVQYKVKIDSKYSTRQQLGWFWRIFQQVKLQSFINAMSGIIRVGLDFAFIWATKLSIDLATGNVSTGGLLPKPSTLFGAGALLISIMALQMALGYLGRWIAALLGVEAQNRMQRHIFEHLLRSEWHGKEQRHSGDVLNRLVSDSQTVVSVVTDTVPQALAVLVRLVCAFFFLFTMDAMLAVGVTVILPVFILLSRMYIRQMRAITREVRQTDSQVQATLQESMQHRLVLKTLERVPLLVKALTSLQTTLRQQVRHRTLFSSTSNLVLNIGFGAAYLFTFLWSVNRLSDGTITFGMMTAFIQLCGQIQGPFRDLTRFIPAIISSFTAAERLMELEEVPLEADGEPIRFEHGAGVRIADITFAYDSHSRKIFNHNTYDFPPGSTTAILGETGAGKTTLIRLILALLKPQKGEVVMYSRDEAGKEDEAVTVSARTRCNLVYVPQGNSLFSGTLRWNLQMGKPDATEAEMYEALNVACADFVNALPDGLDTRIGEGGAGLSEGQAQRLAIARALLRQGSILLMDEATSALDQQTERKLIENLVEHHRLMSVQPTIIFITHRPAVVDFCQQVITLTKCSTS